MIEWKDNHTTQTENTTPNIYYHNPWTSYITPDNAAGEVQEIFNYIQMHSTKTKEPPGKDSTLANSLVEDSIAPQPENPLAQQASAHYGIFWADPWYK